MFKIISILAVAALLSACSSAPVMVNGRTIEKDQVLSSLGDKDKPSWVTDGEQKPVIIKNGMVYSFAQTSIHGNERVEAALRIAESTARANIAKSITNKLESIYQGAEEGVGFDSNQYKWINSELSTMTSHSMTVEGNYWQRVAQSDEDGSRHIVYKAYSLVVISEADYRKAITDSLHEAVAEHKISATFQQQVASQWDRFTGSKDQAATVATKGDQ